MANDLAKTFLVGMKQAENGGRKVTTTLESETLGLVDKWRGNASIKETVASMIAIASQVLELEQQVNVPTNVHERNESSSNISWRTTSRPIA